MGIFGCVFVVSFFFFWSFENMGYLCQCQIVVYTDCLLDSKCEIEREWRLEYKRVSRYPLQIRQKKKRKSTTIDDDGDETRRNGRRNKEGRGGKVMVVMK